LAARGRRSAGRKPRPATASTTTATAWSTRAAPDLMPGFRRQTLESPRRTQAILCPTPGPAMPERPPMRAATRMRAASRRTEAWSGATPATRASSGWSTSGPPAAAAPRQEGQPLGSASLRSAFSCDVRLRGRPSRLTAGRRRIALDRYVRVAARTEGRPSAWAVGSGYSVPGLSARIRPRASRDCAARLTARSLSSERQPRVDFISPMICPSQSQWARVASS
jgi:hypothetical protein